MICFFSFCLSWLQWSVKAILLNVFWCISFLFALICPIIIFFVIFAHKCKHTYCNFKGIIIFIYMFMFVFLLVMFLVAFMILVPHTFFRLFIILFVLFNNRWLLTISTATVTTNTWIWWGTVLDMLACFIFNPMKQCELATTVTILCTSWAVETTIKKPTSFTAWQTLHAQFQMKHYFKWNNNNKRIFLFYGIWIFLDAFY